MDQPRTVCYLVVDAAEEAGPLEYCSLKEDSRYITGGDFHLITRSKLDAHRNLKQ
jgi:hypothetical protein